MFDCNTDAKMVKANVEMSMIAHNRFSQLESATLRIYQINAFPKFQNKCGLNKKFMS